MKSGNVYNHSHYCGKITEYDDGTCSFKYDQSYLEKHLPPVSVTIPLSDKEYIETRLPGFFDGLIPEGWLLNIATHLFKVKSRDRMELLLTVCGDCIGSVTVKREGKRQGSFKDKSIKEHEYHTPKISHSRSSKIKLAKEKQMMSEINFENRCLICGLKSKEKYHALCSKSLFGLSSTNPLLSISLDDIDELAKNNLNQRLSVTGAQSKISLSFSQVKEEKRLTIVTKDGLYILKPPLKEVPDFPANEHCIMNLARSLGIEIAHNGLIQFSTGEYGYLTKRFDREITSKNQINKISMEDFGQIFNRNIDADKYKGSYEQVGMFLKQNASFPGQQLIKFFEYLIFSFIIGNNDLHLKNLALITQNNKIILSPGFDLVSTQLIDPEPKKELTLPIIGKTNNIRKKDLLEFANNLSIAPKAAEKILIKFTGRFKIMQESIHSSFLHPKKQEQLLFFIQKKLAKLF